MICGEVERENNGTQKNVMNKYKQVGRDNTRNKKINVMNKCKYKRVNITWAGKELFLTSPGVW